MGGGGGGGGVAGTSCLTSLFHWRGEVDVVCWLAEIVVDWLLNVPATC